MKKTTNYSLSLYEVNDLANLTDGYNASMNKLDSTVKTVSNQATTNKTNIAAEVTRAKAAEGTLTTNLNAEVTRAKAAESNLNATINKVKNFEKYNVLNYGADTADTASINTAILKMENENLDYIYFPSGVYTVSETINIGVNRKFKGVCGNGSESIFVVNEDVDLAFNCNINAYDHFDGFIDSLTIKSTSDTTHFGTAIKNSTSQYYGLFVSNLFVRNAKEGIRLIEDNQTKYTGLILTHSFFAVFNERNKTYNSLDSKALIIGTDNVITGCRFSGYKYAIYGNTLDGTVVSNCYFWQNYAQQLTYGIYNAYGVNNASAYRAENKFISSSNYFDGIPYPYTAIKLIGNGNTYYYNIKDMQYDGSNHVYDIYSTAYQGSTEHRELIDSGCVSIVNADVLTTKPTVRAINISSEVNSGVFFNYNYTNQFLQLYDTNSNYDMLFNRNVIQNKNSTQCLKIFAIPYKTSLSKSNSFILLNIDGYLFTLAINTSGQPTKTNLTPSNTTLYYEITDNYTNIYLEPNKYIAFNKVFAGSANTVHCVYYEEVYKNASDLKAL